MSALTDKVSEIVLNRITADKLTIPPLPDVAVRALGLLKDPDVVVQKTAAVIEKDPVLSLQVLRSANNAAFGTGGVQTVKQAISKIGNQRLKALVLQSSANKLFQSRDKRIADASQAIWTHSVGVAIIARDLATLLGSADGENAYLAGLLHDVGKAIMASMLLETEKQLNNGAGTLFIGHDDWTTAIQQFHRKVGVALAEKWALPDMVKDAIRDAGDYDNSNRMSVVNFVRFANALTKTQGLYAGEPDLDDAKTLLMIGRSLLSVDESMVERLGANLKARVEQA